LRRSTQMIARELSVADLLHCRYAISPVGEVIEVARAIADPAARAAHGGWLRRHRAALQQVSDTHDLRPLFVLMGPRGCAPDFLRPTPLGPVGEIEADLEQIRATPAERVRREVGRCLHRRGPVANEVERALLSNEAAERLAQLLGAIWSALVLPSWPQVRGPL